MEINSYLNYAHEFSLLQINFPIIQNKFQLMQINLKDT